MSRQREAERKGIKEGNNSMMQQKNPVDQTANNTGNVSGRLDNTALPNTGSVLNATQNSINNSRVEHN